jgi:WD40 repeat protein
VRFWDTATGEPSAKFPTFRGPDGALSLAYSPDGTKLAIGYDAGWVRLWDLAASRELFRAKVHGDDVQSVAFAPDGRTFATSGYEGPFVRIWDAETGQERRKLTFKDAPTFQGLLAFSRDGKRLALGATSRITDGERIVVWDLNEGTDPIIIRKAHDGGLKSLIFTPDGALISCGAAWKQVRGKENEIQLESSPQIRIWDATSGRKLRELDPGVDRGHCKAALSPDGKTFVSLHDDRMLVWDLASGKITRKIDTEVDEKNFGRSVGIAISPEGTMLAAERHDYVVHLWNLTTGKPLFPQDAHDTSITASFSPDGHLVATGDDRGNIRIWDSALGTLLHRLELRGIGRVWSLRFAPDGRSLAAAGEYSDRLSGFRGIAHIWDIPGFSVRHHLRLDDRAVCVEYSPERLVGLSGHKGRIHALTFSPDGLTLVSAGQDDAIRFWDIAAARQVREIPIVGHPPGARDAQRGTPTSIEGATISTDLKTAVTSGLCDDKLVVWDLRAGRVQRTFPVETYVESALAISPDGRHLAVAMLPSRGEDRVARIRIWDIATKRELMRLEPRVSGIRSLAFSADGKTLVSGMSDTTAVVWDISPAYDALKRPQH